MLSSIQMFGCGMDREESDALLRAMNPWAKQPGMKLLGADVLVSKEITERTGMGWIFLGEPISPLEFQMRCLEFGKESRIQQAPYIRSSPNRDSTPR